jgi:hypothetical protein
MYICIYIFVSCCSVCYNLHVELMFRLSLLSFVLKGFMFYLCYLYLFMYTGMEQDFHIRWCSCHLKVAWQVPLVELELLTLLHNLVFMYSILTIVCLFVFLLLVIVLSVSLFNGFWLPLWLWYLQNIFFLNWELL